MNSPWWHQFAACLDRVDLPFTLDPEPDNGQNYTPCFALCINCPVQKQCSDGAGPGFGGVAGGLLFNNGKPFAGEVRGIEYKDGRPHTRRTSRRPQCGTPNGYRMHLRKDEDACRPCSRAEGRRRTVRRTCEEVAA